MNFEAFFSGSTDPFTLLTIAALAGVTVITRSFFFISSNAWSLPSWLDRGMKYAPIAALSAVIAPEVVISHGHVIHTWADARVCAAVSGAAYFFWRRGSRNAVLGTILTGMAVYLPLHVGLGW
jgi:branched-subunit amino acid transport protein